MPFLLDDIAPVARAPISLSVNGRTVTLVPVPSRLELDIRRLLPRPAHPTKPGPGGSLAPRVPVERTDEEWSDFAAAVAENVNAVRCAVVAAAASIAAGSPLDAAAAVEQGNVLAGRWTGTEVDAAYAHLEAVGAMPTAASLALAERGLITRISAEEADRAEHVAAAREGSDGTGGVPWSLGPLYRHGLEYLVLRCCEIFKMTEEDLALMDPARRDKRLAYTRIRMAEEEQLLAVPGPRTA